MLPLPIDHIGIAVSDIEEAIQRWSTQLGYTLLLREELPQHGVRVAFLGTTGTTIELLAPLRGASPLQRFLDKRGPGLHHICFAVQNIRAELKRLSSAGVTLIDETPREGSRNTEIAFLHPESFAGVLIELAQYRT